MTVEATQEERHKEQLTWEQHEALMDPHLRIVAGLLNAIVAYIEKATPPEGPYGDRIIDFLDLPCKLAVRLALPTHSRHERIDCDNGETVDAWLCLTCGSETGPNGHTAEDI